MKKLSITKTKGNGKNVYSPSAIICFEGDGEYTHVYITDSVAPGWRKIPSVSVNLGQFESRLYDFGFQRTSKSMVVNLDCVRGWDYEDKDIIIELSPACCPKIKLGDRWREEFFKRLLINF